MLEKRKPSVGLVMKSLEAEFFKDMKKGALEYVKSRGGIELIALGTKTQTEITKQIHCIEELIDKRVDAIVVVPIDSKALVSPVVKAVKSGITVINIDIMLDQTMLGEHNISIPFIGPDNVTAAKAVGDILGKELGQGGKVIIIEGVPAAMNAQQRKQGFLNSISEYKLNLLASGVANWETEQAYSVFSSLLPQHSDVQGVMCANDAMALGVLKAIEEKKMQGIIKIIGFDNDESVRPLVRNGALLATIDCFGTHMAVKGIEYALRALNGEEFTGWIKTDMKIITA